MAVNMTRVPVREQEPLVRAKNFEEVCLGYNEEEAMAEAAFIVQSHSVCRDVRYPSIFLNLFRQ